MVYHVIIALNGEGKRKVGKIISLLEENGLELCGSKRIQNPVLEPTIIGEILLNAKIGEFPAMEFYRIKFSHNDLKKEIKHLYGNHLELFFESDDESVNPNELWELIVEKIFNGGEKVPLMFVTTSIDGNGLNSPFIPNPFEPDETRYFPARTLMPIGQ